MRNESMQPLLSEKKKIGIPVLPASVLNIEPRTADIFWSSSFEAGTEANKHHNNTAIYCEITGWVLNIKSEMV